MRSRLGPLSCFLSIVLLLPSPSFAMDTTLSDEAIREAYFLGQRHDKDLSLMLDKYTRYLSAPESGPAVSSVTFFTPFALAALNSSKRIGYSAQQAALDHRNQQEIVRVVIQIQLTDSYGPYLTKPTGSRSGSPVGIALRPSSFWQDFRVHVLNNDKQVLPVDASGEPTFNCDQSSCILTGAIIHFDFPADAFPSETAIIRIAPPEGDSFTIDFDLTDFR